MNFDFKFWFDVKHLINLAEIWIVYSECFCQVFFFFDFCSQFQWLNISIWSISFFLSFFSISFFLWLTTNHHGIYILAGIFIVQCILIFTWLNAFPLLIEPENTEIETEMKKNASGLYLQTFGHCETTSKMSCRGENAQNCLTSDEENRKTCLPNRKQFRNSNKSLHIMLSSSTELIGIDEVVSNW